MKSFLLLIAIILITQTFSKEYSNGRSCSRSKMKISCQHCFRLFTCANDSQLQVIPCGGVDCIALIVNNQPSADNKRTTAVNFDFNQCGVEKRCRKPVMIEREKQKDNISMKKNSNSDKNTKETNDAIERGEFPWMVRIENRRNASDQIVNQCGGTLIHPQWVLTAAHCMLDMAKRTLYPADYINIYTGERARKMTNDTRWTVHSSLYIIHPKFRMTRSVTSIHDFALIKLSRPVEMNVDVNVVCLPDQYTSLKDGTGGFVGVWNNASSIVSTVKHARRIRLRLTDAPTCRRYSSLTKIDEVLHVCAHNDHGHNICSGDSGSGLYIRARKANSNKWKWYSFGVASFGKSECSTKVNHDNAFAAIHSHMNWIQHVIEKYSSER